MLAEHDLLFSGLFLEPFVLVLEELNSALLVEKVLAEAELS